MIFFATGDGTIIKTLPSPVYQGSQNASEIYLIAPFSPNMQVAVRYKLPNGVWTTPELMENGIKSGNMTQQGALASPDGAIVDKETGKKYAVWSKPIGGDVTRYYGTVTAQFFFYAAQGRIVTSTSAADFLVGKGVPSVLPDEPSDDVYEAILSNISALQEQLNNGVYTARSIYAWNSLYTYGANEIVFYPSKGEYGVFLKSLASDNATAPYTDGVLNAEKWEEVVDFNILNALYSLSDDLTDAVETANEIVQRAETAEQSASASAQNAANSAEESEANAKRVEDAADYLENIKDGSEAVLRAIADGTGNNIAEHFEEIENLIPSTTTPENQLADKAFVNSSINNLAAFYITSNASGDAFSTRASLLAATTFYSGGQVRVPTQNDYAIVLADESQPKGVDGNYPTTRYSYQGGTYPNGQWDFQYVVNNTSLTQAQVDAINSGITTGLVDKLDGIEEGAQRNPTNYVTTNTEQTISGVKTFTNPTTMYGLRILSRENYDPTLYFAGNLVSISQPSSSALEITSRKLNLRLLDLGGLQINGSSGTAGQVLTSNGTSAPTWETISGTVTGVKGNAETAYRTGNVNLTPANIGAVNKSGDTMTGGLTLANNTWNASGDDAFFGDRNQAGGFCIKGQGGDTNITMFQQNSDTNTAKIIFNGSTINIDKAILEKGSRVYSPNNKPSLSVLGINTLNSRLGYITVGSIKLVWGYTTVNNGTHTINFHSTFSTECYNVQYSRALGTFDWDKTEIESISRTGFTFRNDANTCLLYYFAIGY